jgi:hypothetical protein
MKAKLNWKEIGRFVSVLVQLYTNIVAVFKKAKVGPEVVEWLVGPGKDTLVRKIEELTVEFSKANSPEVPKAVEVSMLTAEIDTDQTPKLPFDGAIIEAHVEGGTVTIEKRDDELWIDDKKVILHLVSGQQGGNWIRGHELREELSGKPVLNACVLDFLLENTSFIPDSWKKDANGNTVYVFFWGTIYRHSDGSLCVRDLYWHDGAWQQDYNWLDDDWHGGDPAALLAS